MVIQFLEILLKLLNQVAGLTEGTASIGEMTLQQEERWSTILIIMARRLQCGVHRFSPNRVSPTHRRKRRSIPRLARLQRHEGNAVLPLAAARL